jgi:hypothetical protein
MKQRMASDYLLPIMPKLNKKQRFTWSRIVSSLNHCTRSIFTGLTSIFLHFIYWYIPSFFIYFKNSKHYPINHAGSCTDLVKTFTFSESIQIKNSYYPWSNLRRKVWIQIVSWRKVKCSLCYQGGKAYNAYIICFFCSSERSSMLLWSLQKLINPNSGTALEKKIRN